MIKAYLSLGSNLGDKEMNIKKAVELLQQTDGIDITMVSGCYDTEPEGMGKNQPRFVNSVVELYTTLPPRDLLEKTQHIEADLGRTNKNDLTPRLIDIDIILYGDDIIIEEDLTIPHPLMHERFFVLEPLHEIAPEVVHPVMGDTVEHLLHQLQNGYGTYN